MSKETKIAEIKQLLTETEKLLKQVEEVRKEGTDPSVIGDALNAAENKVAAAKKMLQELEQKPEREEENKNILTKAIQYC